jgi:hypothetical protein
MEVAAIDFLDCVDEQGMKKVNMRYKNFMQNL